MDTQLKESLDQLLKSVSVEQNVSALTLAVYLLVGGAMSLYVRFLYRQCGTSASDADSITRVFPLLTLVTIGVIAVVKSSMAVVAGPRRRAVHRALPCSHQGTGRTGLPLPLHRGRTSARCQSTVAGRRAIDRILDLYSGHVLGQ